MRAALATWTAALALLAACAQESPGPVAIVDTPGLRAWLTAQRPRPVLLNFWATWCAPCVAELPELVAGTRAFRDQGGVVVAVALEYAAGEADPFAAIQGVEAVRDRAGLDVTTLICDAEDLIVLRRDLDLDLGPLPQTFVLGPDGAVVARHEGAIDRDEFAELAAAARR